MLRLKGQYDRTELSISAHIESNETLVIDASIGLMPGYSFPYSMTRQLNFIVSPYNHCEDDKKECTEIPQVPYRKGWFEFVSLHWDSNGYRTVNQSCMREEKYELG